MASGALCIRRARACQQFVEQGGPVARIACGVQQIAASAVLAEALFKSSSRGTKRRPLRESSPLLYLTMALDGLSGSDTAWQLTSTALVLFMTPGW